MISLTSYTQYYNYLTNYNNRYPMSFSGVTNNTARLADLFYNQAVPTGYTVVYTSSTPTQRTKDSGGAIPIPSIFSGGTLKLLGVDSFARSLGSLHIIMDRLVEVSGISGNTTALQTVNTGTLPRFTDGKDVVCLIIAENAITASIVSTGNTTLSYTNQDGVAGRTGTVQINTATDLFARQQSRFMNLQFGDTGVRSVESIQFNSVPSSTAAGAFNIILAKPIGMFMNSSTMSGPNTNFSNLINGRMVGGFPNINENACLFTLRNSVVFGSVIGGSAEQKEINNFIITEVYEV